jgi:hypothetical protein
MPSAEDTRQFGFEFSIENEALIGVLCRQAANGECLPVEEGKEGGYGAVGIGYQLAGSESQSLWE